ncbi:hypothetical protein J2W91_001859 [Paenibacillus amylolyticus]|uniref:Uncharacterized protein n=1 Tax=Paenibacillus amylolyticus TaxID=1451 RepID=A0AAP5H0A0_PAEAM|nr:hypothetical protein [Paenibacillus amylolyticus]MDR6723407.1 hypothetical protein [Paenibacillus amylolyticus]
MKRMSISELNEILVKATLSAREEAKMNGVPIVYEENEKMIKEYPNGRKTEIIFDENGKKTEIEYP